MGLQLNSNEIAKILPHRYPFALVDRITDGESGVWAKGIKCVSVGEPFFCGHFPQKHVMPGVLILEALAQVGAVAILSLPENRGKIALFGGVKNARFKRGHPRRRSGAGMYPHEAPGSGGHRRLHRHGERRDRLHRGADLRHPVTVSPLSDAQACYSKLQHSSGKLPLLLFIYGYMSAIYCPTILQSTRFLHQNAQNLKILPQRIDGGRCYPYNKNSDLAHT